MSLQDLAQACPGASKRKLSQMSVVVRGNHLSSTSCLTLVFFKSGE